MSGVRAILLRTNKPLPRATTLPSGLDTVASARKRLLPEWTARPAAESLERNGGHKIVHVHAQAMLELCSEIIEGVSRRASHQWPRDSPNFQPSKRDFFAG